MANQEEIEEKAKKRCVKCDTMVPDSFGNPLCIPCYELLEEQKKKLPPEEPVVDKIEEHKNGITEETYVEHPEAEDKEQWEDNINVFRKRGVMLWHPTKAMYNFIKDYHLDKIKNHPQYPKFIWKPKVVDVGCGAGIGSNILSLEADFVWGIDKNEKSIQFAKECFTRVKNNIYYTPQVTFDVIDVMKDTREFAQFNTVVAIEIIEHIDDYRGFLKMLTRFENRDKRGNIREDDRTEYFISTPNRNNRRIGDHGPKNKYHVREWTSGEFYNVLDEFFAEIRFFNSKGELIPNDEYMTTEHTPLLAKCTNAR